MQFVKQMSSKVTGEDCAYIIQKLQRVASFMQCTLAPPHSEEHASLQALKLFISKYIITIKMIHCCCKKNTEIFIFFITDFVINLILSLYRCVIIGFNIG